MHFCSLNDLSAKEIKALLKQAHALKKKPQKYKSALEGTHLLFMSSLPSLRTRMAFEQGIAQMGGTFGFYDINDSIVGDREEFEEFIKSASYYTDILALRCRKHSYFRSALNASKVPLINALTNKEAPLQALTDLMTIEEAGHTLEETTLLFLGDGRSPHATSLIFAAAATGMKLIIACPRDKSFRPDPFTLLLAKKCYPEADIEIVSSARKAIAEADVIYSDLWLSYFEKTSNYNKRYTKLKSFQINEKLLKRGKEGVLVMHPQPLMRDFEITTAVLSSPQSILDLQAQNKLHMQKAMLLKIMGKEKASKTEVKEKVSSPRTHKSLKKEAKKPKRKTQKKKTIQ